MINGLLGEINESFHISKHFVLNVQQHTLERRIVAILYTQRTSCFHTIINVLFTLYVFLVWPELLVKGDTSTGVACKILLWLDLRHN